MKYNINITASLIGLLLGLSDASKPNILFIFSDDHSWQAIGAYNELLKDVAVTPNIDKLAEQGMLFNRCYVTNSICGPSRAVIQTGKYSHVNGVLHNGNSFDVGQQTFPKLLRAAGYETALIGKWHLKNNPEGYDHWDILSPTDKHGQGSYYNPIFRRGDLNGQIEERRINGFNAVLTTDMAMDWISQAKENSKPFMMMLQFKETHREWEPAVPYYSHYENIEIPEPKNLLDTYEYRGTAARNQDMTIRHTLNKKDVKLDDPYDFTTVRTQAQQDEWNNFYDKVKADFAAKGFDWEDKTDDELVRWKYQRYLKDYLACGMGMDANIGRMMGFLDENNLSDSTIVIYASDQGFYLGEHGWFDKRFMYEESFKTPLIVRWPGVVTPGSRNDDLVSNVDFAQTFLEMAGVPSPGDMQGGSLVPILQGNTPSDWRQSLYYEYYQGFDSWHKVYKHYGVTTGRHKLIYFHPLNEWEFYDLKRDPNEMVNQYFIPENDSIIEALKEELISLRTELGVEGELPDDLGPSWDYEVQTEQLPIVGCDDPNYQEYDPEVGRADPEACRTLNLFPSKGSGDEFSFQMALARKGIYRLKFSEGLPLESADLMDTRGQLMGRGFFNGGQWEFRLPATYRGVFLIKASLPHRVVYRKVIL